MADKSAFVPVEAIADRRDDVDVDLDEMLFGKKVGFLLHVFVSRTWIFGGVQRGGRSTVLIIRVQSIWTWLFVWIRFNKYCVIRRKIFLRRIMKERCMSESNSYRSPTRRWRTSPHSCLLRQSRIEKDPLKSKLTSTLNYSERRWGILIWSGAICSSCALLHMLWFWKKYNNGNTLATAAAVIHMTQRSASAARMPWYTEVSIGSRSLPKTAAPRALCDTARASLELTFPVSHLLGCYSHSLLYSNKEKRNSLSLSLKCFWLVLAADWSWQTKFLSKH